MDRNWIQNRNKCSTEYIQGVKSFMNLAQNHTDSRGQTRCPCRNCSNVLFQLLDDVEEHLFVYGFDRTYTKWVHHGENMFDDEVDLYDNDDYTTYNEAEEPDFMQHILEDVHAGTYMRDYWGEASDNNSSYVPEGQTSSSLDSNKFAKLLREMQCELYPGCKNLSKLSFLIKLLHIKVLNGWTIKSFDMVLQLFKDALPDDETLPKSHYGARKIMRELGLGYKSIHACKNDCMLFWKDHKEDKHCSVCGETRYKFVEDQGKKKKIPQKVLRYFPLRPRLQRLFMCRKTATDMVWHKAKRVDDGILRHPADSEAWKDFDKQHDWFSKDPRNVRLALATDGFNLFGNMSNSYSMWPVVLMVYNLPPWMCMKDPFFMMSLLIPGPRSPGNEIDVYLRPLIDELKELWEEGVDTFDASKKQIFRMHAAVLWTINDFPAFAMLSGWMTKGKMACPVCNKETSFFSLKNGKKICYMCHRRFLPSDHSWRKNKQAFDGKQEHRQKPNELSGDDLLEQLIKVNVVSFGKGPNSLKRKRHDYELNWTKKSIFFELPYWRTLKLRHNLDVMHIEKNICESVIGTLLDIDGKTKDTIKARMDLKEMGIKKELHLIPNGDKFTMPHACYQLSSTEKKGFYEWLKSIKFPDGYASNISRCVNVRDRKLSGMKSHDCHVLLQRLLPVGIRGYLRKDVCTALTELSFFFNKLCSRTLELDDLKQMEKDIVIILCKMERIFPPAFFDIMVHLTIHLPREAILAGPVPFRWMYPIERFLYTLKKNVRNTARPEGSIAEAYVDKECLTFCSMYLEGVETRFNRDERNDDRSQGNKREGLYVFRQDVRTLGASTYYQMPLTDLDKAQMYILNNCDEVLPYVNEHIQHLKSHGFTNVQERHEQQFPRWFEHRMKRLHEQKAPEATDQLYFLGCGPDSLVTRHSGCIVNGIRFHTTDHNKRRRTQNSGVVVKGEHDSKEIDFYGILVDVMVFKYLGGNKVYLFKCDWWNVGNQRMGIHSDGNITSVNLSSRWYKDDPYVLACQAEQVFYMKDPKFGNNWHVVQRVAPRNLYQVAEMSLVDEDKEIDDDDDDSYEVEDSGYIDTTVQYGDIELDPLHREDVEPAYVDATDVLPNNTTVDQINDDFINDDESEDEDDTLIDYCDDEDDVELLSFENDEEDEELLFTDNESDMD